MLAPGLRVGVAVSGGADSVCLLHVLREIAPAGLSVLHVDHQLRGEESQGDAQFVAKLARRFDLPLILRQADLRAGNLEEAGREARLALFRETIRSGAVDRVATGHTRSDQAETVLFRLLRGAAGAGLAAIRPVTTEGLIRPLIEIGREEVEDFLRERGIEWREDSTNASRVFARNRIRHDLIPQLERDWNPELVVTLARTADWAAAEESYWQQELDRIAAGALVSDGSAVLVDARIVRELPLAAARRLIRRAIEQAKGDLRGVDFDHVEAVLRLADANRGSGRIRASGIEVRRSFERLRFIPSPEAQMSAPYHLEAAVPGFLPIAGTGRAICLELIEKTEAFDPRDCVYNEGMGWVDWDRVSGSLALRNWMPGDRYQPATSARIKKLKTLFQLARIPSWERCHWPVLVAGDSIVWTRQFGPAAEYAAGPHTRTVLTVRETEAV
jgi:tRNA(Ile)-lysidine synthase